jgi:methionyl-tRNA synthetase
MESTMSRILITSALSYINGVKHLGNLAGSLLPADIHARFCRQRGHDVLFLCGTDEHGTPAELAAREAGLDVAAYCVRQHAVQADIYRPSACRSTISRAPRRARTMRSRRRSSCASMPPG